MLVDAHHLQRRQVLDRLVLRQRPPDVDAELALAQSGRDVRMRLGVHVRIDPQGHARRSPQFRGDLADAAQLLIRLHVEHEDVGLEGVRDLLAGLPHAGVHDPLRRDAGREPAEQFAARHHVQAAPEIRQRASAPPDWRWPSGQSTRGAGPGQRPRPAPGNAWSAWHDYRCRPACRPRPRCAQPGHPRSRDRRLDVESDASALGFPERGLPSPSMAGYVANGYHRTPRLSKRKTATGSWCRAVAAAGQESRSSSWKRRELRDSRRGQRSAVSPSRGFTLASHSRMGMCCGHVDSHSPQARHLSACCASGKKRRYARRVPARCP